MHLRRREGESIRSLLFAIRVLESPQGGGAGEIHEVSAFGHGRCGQLGNDNGDVKALPFQVEGFTSRPVLHISAGCDHTAVVTCDGEVFTFGSAEDGMLGHGLEGCDEFVPRRVEELKGRHVVVQAVCGGAHTVVLTDDGDVFTFGWGGHGQLGHGDLDREYTPRRVEALKGKHVVQVAAGEHHTVALTKDGDVFTFGSAEDGMLGHGLEEGDAFVPRRVEALQGRHVVHVAVGEHHTVALTKYGEVFTFGRGGHGALGHGDDMDQMTPRRVDSFLGRHVIQIAAGGGHTAAVTDDGEMFTFGWGRFWQLGHGEGIGEELRPRRVDALAGKRVVQVAAGDAYYAVITSNGEVFTFGSGEFGQLGHGLHLGEPVPRRVDALCGRHTVMVSAGIAHTLALSIA